MVKARHKTMLTVHSFFPTILHNRRPEFPSKAQTLSMAVTGDISTRTVVQVDNGPGQDKEQFVRM